MQLVEQRMYRDRDVIRVMLAIKKGHRLWIEEKKTDKFQDLSIASKSSLTLTISLICIYVLDNRERSNTNKGKSGFRPLNSEQGLFFWLPRFYLHGARQKMILNHVL